MMHRNINHQHHRHPTVFQNDENAIPMQQKQLSSSSSSSFVPVKKSKKEMALKPLNSNTSSFPKTPLSKNKSLSSKTTTARRRALGDISNRKKASGNAGGGLGGGSKSVKKGLAIHMDNGLVKPTSSSTTTTATATTSKKLKKKKKNVTFDQVIFQDDLNEKIKNVKPRRSKSVVTSESSNNVNLVIKIDDIDDIELFAGRSYDQEQYRLQNMEHNDFDDESLMELIENFDYDEQLRQGEMDQYMNEAKRVEASFEKSPQELFEYEDVPIDFSHLMISDNDVGDHFRNEFILPLVEDDDGDNEDPSHQRIDLCDISI